MSAFKKDDLPLPFFPSTRLQPELRPVPAALSILKS